MGGSLQISTFFAAMSLNETQEKNLQANIKDGNKFKVNQLILGAPRTCTISCFFFVQNNLAEQIDARFENNRNAAERGTRSSQKNLQNHITKKFNGIHNHFTLLTMMLLN